MGNVLAIDTETTGAYLYRGCKPFMVTACDDDGKEFIWEFPVDPLTREPVYDTTTINNIQDVITSYDTWIFHNALFDIKALSLIPWTSHWFPCLGSYDDHIEEVTIHDTMLMAHCHNSLDRLGLKGLALQYTGYPEDDEKQLLRTVNKCRHIGRKLKWATAEPTHPHLTPLKSDKPKCDYWLPAAVHRHHPDLLSKEDADACNTYAIGDVVRTMALYIFFQGRLKYQGIYTQYDQNRKCIIPTYRMQSEGLTVKTKVVPQTLTQLKEHIDETLIGLRRLSRKPKLNPRSAIQLREVIYDQFDIDIRRFTNAGEPSTDKEAIAQILEASNLTPTVEQFCKRLLTYRQLNTTESYLKSYQRHKIKNKLYGNLNITGTTTTRYSHKDPNTGNISKQGNNSNALNLTVDFNLRRIFGPPNGHLWLCVDYKQLQSRIFAHACQDAYLIRQFELGMDAHDMVAREIFSTETPSSLERRAAKNINFGILFGAGRARIERMARMPGCYDLFKSRFPLVDEYIKECEQKVRRTGYVHTLGGYRLYVQKSNAYKGCNFVVQGTEGELVKEAINQCDDYCYDLPVLTPIMVIHDEIIFQTSRITREEFITDHSHHLSSIFKLMNDAASSVGVITEVDYKVTSTLWSEATELTEAELNRINNGNL